MVSEIYRLLKRMIVVWPLLIFSLLLCVCYVGSGKHGRWEWLQWLEDYVISPAMEWSEE